MGWDAGRLRSVVIDCADPHALAPFWAAALKYERRPVTDEDLAWLEEHGIERVEDDPSIPLDPPATGMPTFWLNQVPEPKQVKNRVHVDINLDDVAEVDALVALGASILRQPLEDEPWFVMADPEGHEFCAFPPRLTDD